MKKNISVFIIIIISFLIVPSIQADRYLSRNEILNISGSSIGIAVIGYLSEHSVTESRSALISGPILFDSYFQEQIGSDILSGHQNTSFIDKRFGLAITPLFGITSLMTIDYFNFKDNRNRKMLQDGYLFSSGLLVTVGVTALFKGLAARERPYVYYAETEITPFDKDNKLSFFSGHTAAAFYTMHYLNKRLGYIMSKSGSGRPWQYIKSFSCYGWASYVAYSRIETAKHFATDVIVGAGVGLLIGELFYQKGVDSSRKLTLTTSLTTVSITYHF